MTGAPFGCLSDAGTGTFPRPRDWRSRSVTGGYRGWTATETVPQKGVFFDHYRYCNAVPPQCNNYCDDSHGTMLSDTWVMFIHRIVVGNGYWSEATNSEVFL